MHDYDKLKINNDESNKKLTDFENHRVIGPREETTSQPIKKQPTFSKESKMQQKQASLNLIDEIQLVKTLFQVEQIKCKFLLIFNFETEYAFNLENPKRPNL